ncbi:MAG: type I methionyl aminopeptidase [Candidatus Latescibacter sp.]|nr:type I methionyl aminopeptidase [Candidatus Latescibacter sp.]
MIHIRSEREIEKLRSVCRLAAETMEIVRDEVRAGTTTLHISEKARKFIESHGAQAAFLGYNGFPGAICVSVNDEVVHGIPGERVLEESDIVKIDLGAYKDGFYGDMARVYPVGGISKEATYLIETTSRAFFEGAGKAVPGNHIGDIGGAVQNLVEALGYSVVRALVGHGIGRRLHEEPQIPNFTTPRNPGALLKAGMVLAIEPMVNAGTWEVETLEDNWTVVTADGKLSAHYENTCVVRDGFPEILTLMNGEEIWPKTKQ